VAGSAPCDDAVGCTVDTCDEAGQSCTHTPDDALCGNGLFCDGAETCDALLDCQAGTPVDCDDGNACTVNSCNELDDVCDSAPLPDADADGVCDSADNCPSVKNGPAEAAVERVGDQTDTDGDGVGDACDNCQLVSNPPISAQSFQTTTGGQLDDDADGYGNRCDGDFSQSGSTVGGIDTALYLNAVGQPVSDPSACNGPCDRFDLSGSGSTVGGVDTPMYLNVLGSVRDDPSQGIWVKCPECGPPFDPNLPCVGDACP
jgi:hypothetical protein